VADRDAADAEVGDLARQVADAVDLAVGQHLLAEGRDGDGGLLQVGGAALGGDDHLLDGRGGVGVGSRTEPRRRGLAPSAPKRMRLRSNKAK
jgi:hypothetical protein